MIQRRYTCGTAFAPIAPLFVMKELPMRRRDFAKLALAGGAATIAAPAVVRAQTTFNWKMTSFYGPNSAFYSTGPGSAKDLISRIEAMSNGRIKIQFYGAGELIPAAEGFDAVSAGTVEMNYANAYFWTGKSRSEEHTSELQSQSNLVCRLLLEKK